MVEVAHFLHEVALDGVGHEWAHVAAAAYDFADDGGADVRILRFADEKDGFKALADGEIELRNDALVVKVGGGA